MSYSAVSGRERSRQAMEIAAQINQRLHALIAARCLYGAEEHTVGADFRYRIDLAIERDQRIDQHRRTGVEALPFSRQEAFLDVDALARKQHRQLLLAGRQHVDAQGAVLFEDSVVATVAINAEHQRRRLVGYGASGQTSRTIAGDDVDGGAEAGHGFAKNGFIDHDGPSLWWNRWNGLRD